jgi:transcription initiation factor TFIIH subunit 2
MSASAGTDGNGKFTHTWEAVKSDANWSSINEDANGNIITNVTTESLADQIRQRRKQLSKLDHAQSSRRIIRDMIRYTYLVLDLSEAVYQKDSSLGMGASKTQLNVQLQLAEEFVNEYYDQNPLSHLGIVVCKNGEAQVLSLISGSKRAAAMALGAVREGVNSGLVGKDAGEFSLQNGLEVAGRSLGHMPRHGSREVLIMVGALRTCDPGDVLVESLPRLVSAGIRVNCLALCAEIYVCRKICEGSGGVMGVALDGKHLRDLLMNFTRPPPALSTESDETKQNTCQLVPMGFPTRETKDVPTLMYAVASAAAKDNKLFFARTGYVCPRCKAKVSELPTDCTVCGLKLVLAPHLARSFHHLFPVPPFEEVAEHDVFEALDSEGSNLSTGTLTMNLPPVTISSSSIEIELSSKVGFKNHSKLTEINIDSSLLFSSKDCDRVCFSCMQIIGVQNIQGPKSKKKISQGDSNLDRSIGDAESLRFQCPDCKNVFCADCDAYLHETLHNCPGCLICPKVA